MKRVVMLLLACPVMIANCLAANLCDEPGWQTNKYDPVKTLPKLLGDYKNLPDYIDAMKAVHARFTGTPRTLAMFGASQTSSKTFWIPLQNGGTNMSAQMQKDFALVKGYMKPECWNWKGGSHGNSGGMLAKWVNETACVDVLKKLNPEVVIILIGQSDMDQHLKAANVQEAFEGWKATLTEACQKCLSNGTVVILCTFTPRASRRMDVYNEAILQIAATLKTPVIDWGGECIKRSPTDWNGAELREEYKDKIYEVPRLLCADGQHASYPSKYAGDWSEESLSKSGDNLRSYLTLTVYADVLRQVFGVQDPAPARK